MSEAVTSYPLCWPLAWKRTSCRSCAVFGNHSTYKATKEIIRQFELMGVPDYAIVISANIELRQDGLPYSNRRAPMDPGVAVYFRLDGDRRVLACDRWDKVEHNLWAIAKHVEALRGIDRWGVGSLEQAFRGYTALPEGRTEETETWWEILEFDSPSVSKEELTKRWKQKAMETHPDQGGSNEAFQRVRGAFKTGWEELGL